MEKGQKAGDACGRILSAVILILNKKIFKSFYQETVLQWIFTIQQSMALDFAAGRGRPALPCYENMLRTDRRRALVSRPTHIREVWRKDITLKIMNNCKLMLH